MFVIIPCGKYLDMDCVVVGLVINVSSLSYGYSLLISLSS